MEVQAVGGVDHAPDQTIRMREFIKRHPEVTITAPRQNKSNEFKASWAQDPEDRDGVMEGASHYLLRCLMDYLEARFDH